MNDKTLATVIIIALMAVAGFGGWALHSSVGATPSHIHQHIVNQMIVTAQISSPDLLNEPLSPTCLRSEPRILKSLDIAGIASKAKWYGTEADLSEWVWEYQGYPMAFMKLWGPPGNTSQILLEFSKCVMTRITVECAGETFTLDMSMDNPDEGYFYVWFEVNN